MINSCYCYQYSAVPEKGECVFALGQSQQLHHLSKASILLSTPSFNCFSHFASVWPHLNPQQHFNPHPLFLTIPSFPLALFLMASFSWYHHQGKFTRWEESMDCSSKTSASGRVFYWNHKQYCISYTIACREGGRKADGRLLMFVYEGWGYIVW